MELSQLPPEMVAAVADHLGARDVTACSGASRVWRTAFNIDRIWRNYCSLGLEYFRDPSVKPGFEVPLDEGAALEPLCDWRVAFLSELHILKNWQKGLFTSEEVELRTNACLYMMDGVDSRQNHWMFLCCTSREGLKMEVWNIKNVPYLQMTTKMCTIFKNIDETVQNDEVNFKLHLSGRKLLFIYDNLVTAYEFDHPYQKLNFLYNLSIVHTAPCFSPKRIPRLPQGSICEVEILGSLLFGVTYTSSDRTQRFSPSVHVWDIETPIKIKDHCVSEPKSEHSYSTCNLMLTSGQSDNLVITRVFDKIGVSSKVRIFNRSKCEYTNFYIDFKSLIIWNAVADDIVVLCELVNNLERNCVFHFYKVDSTACIYKTGTYHIYDPEKISSCGTKFAFIDLNSDVTVIDIVTQQALVKNLHPSRNRLKTLTMVNENLLLLESKYRGTSRSFQNVLVTSYEVWDFHKDSKPLRLEQCFRSVARTKFTFMRNCIPPKLLTIVHPLYRPITVCINSFW